MITPRWLMRLPAFALSAAIITTSHQSIAVPTPFTLADKVYHFIVYAIYGWTLVLALRTWHLTDRQCFVIALMVGVIFAAIDEVHQAFVPGRTADVLDWIADSVGILSAVFLTMLRKLDARTK